MQKLVLLPLLVLSISACTQAEYPMSSRKLGKNHYELKLIGEKGAVIDEMQKQMHEHADRLCKGSMMQRTARTETIVSRDRLVKPKGDDGYVYILTTNVDCIPADMHHAD